MAGKRKGSKQVDKQVSLHPLSPEKALHGFMQVDPNKVKRRGQADRRRRAGQRVEKKRKSGG